MHICIDSCTLIHGLQESDPSAVQLLDLLGKELIIMIPRLVAQEVTRNLNSRASEPVLPTFPQSRVCFYRR